MNLPELEELFKLCQKYHVPSFKSQELEFTLDLQAPVVESESEGPAPMPPPSDEDLLFWSSSVPSDE